MRRPGSQPNGARVVALAATSLFVGASLFVGVRSMHESFVVAFRDAGLSVFTPQFQEQVERVRKRVPPGAGILLVGTVDLAWQARLWQRALYPRNGVVVHYGPMPGDGGLERGADFVLALGAPPGLALGWREDLGAMQGGPEHVWIGTVER